MNKLTSLKQISAFRPNALSDHAHQVLTKKVSLKHFELNSEKTYLRSTFTFDNTKYSQVLNKMAIIGQVADEMDHHPEWTLKGDKLEIGLSTHECQGKVSIKDYILASWIESIWSQGPVQERLMSEWNSKDINDLNEIK